MIFVKFVPPATESRLKKKLVKTKKARELFKTYVIFVKCVPPGPDSAVLTTSLPL